MNAVPGRSNPASLTCRHLATLVLLGLLVLVLSLPAFAETSFQSEVDRDSLSTDDVLFLSVTLTLSGGDDGGEPELSPTKDFAVLGTPQRQDGYSMVNTQITRYSQRVFTLQPRRAGTLTVPSATVTVNGKTLRTAQIRVEVTRGSAASVAPAPPSSSSGRAPFEGNPDFAIQVRADRRELYVNEQLLLSVDYYTGVPVPEDLGQRTPVAEGFVAESLTSPRPERVVVNNMEYGRLTRRWALFAASPGKKTVSAAPETIATTLSSATREYRSNTLEISVKPLPTPPEGMHFSGAVGSFTVQLQAEKQQVKAGEGLTVRVIVDGVGNLRSVSAPPLDLGDACKVYASGEKRKIEPRALGSREAIGGRAEFEYLVVPRRSGTLEIPALSFAYFNPDSGRYETTHSDPAQVNVTPGEVLQEPAAASQEGTLRHIHTEHPRLVSRSPRTVIPFVLLVALLCVGSVVWAAWRRIDTDRRLADPLRARSLVAGRAARKALAAAETASGESFYEELGDGVYRYLADKFGLPTAGVYGEALREALLQHGVDASLAEAARDLVATCHRCRYAPSGMADTPREQALAQARQLLDALEQGVRP